MELESLYQEVIMDHNKNPRCFHKLSEYTHTADGFNPLCGDKVQVYLLIKDNKIVDIGFTGVGCAISQASASMMCQIVKNYTIEEILELSKIFREGLTKDIPIDKDIGSLEALLSVKKFPMRVKCATLAWHTLENSLKGEKHG